MAGSTKIVIGFRVEPTKIHYAVVTGSKAEPTLVAADTVPAPKDWEQPEALQWYRTQVASIIDQYNPSSSMVRDAEASRFSNAQSLQSRCRIEGVVMEVACTKGLSVGSGRLKTISANLDSKAAKKYLDGDDLRGLDWSDHSKYVREAIMAAVSGLEE